MVSCCLRSPLSKYLNSSTEVSSSPELHFDLDPSQGSSSAGIRRSKLLISLRGWGMEMMNIPGP